MLTYRKEAVYIVVLCQDDNTFWKTYMWLSIHFAIIFQEKMNTNMG